jgi:3alpha(or 20beta)-hydroxysteroid dehydrogenase
MSRLNSKVALISGAARGTGEATARLFAAEGAKVVIADIADDAGAAVAADIGDAACFVRLDVTDEASWQAAVKVAVDRFGKLDVLVNNAGILHMAAIGDTTVADFERVCAVNQKGVFLGMKSAEPAIREAGGGAIVNVASIDGVQAKTGLVAYSATKWAVRGMTRVAALEFGKHGIRVNTVCPEAGSGDMIKPYLPEGVGADLPRQYEHRLLAHQRTRETADFLGDIAKAILYFASDDSLTCTGTDLILDSGITAGKRVKGAPGA